MPTSMISCQTWCASSCRPPILSITLRFDTTTHTSLVIGTATARPVISFGVRSAIGHHLIPAHKPGLAMTHTLCAIHALELDVAPYSSVQCVRLTHLHCTEFYCLQPPPLPPSHLHLFLCLPTCLSVCVSVYLSACDRLESGRFQVRIPLAPGFFRDRVIPVT